MKGWVSILFNSRGEIVYHLNTEGMNTNSNYKNWQVDKCLPQILVVRDSVPKNGFKDNKLQVILSMKFTVN